MPVSSQNREPDKNLKSAFGFTGPSKGGGRKGAGKAGKDPSGGRAGEVFAGPTLRGPAGSPFGMVSKTNNDGNLATRQSPNRRPRIKSLCFITTACVEARGLPDDCYELRLLRLFHDEYVAKLPDGPRILSEYERKAPRIVAVVKNLGEEEAERVWDDLYERGVRRAVAHIVNGRWDEAYEVYTSRCRELEWRLSPALASGGENHDQKTADLPGRG